MVHASRENVILPLFILSYRNPIQQNLMNEIIQQSIWSNLHANIVCCTQFLDPHYSVHAEIFIQIFNTCNIKTLGMGKLCLKRIYKMQFSAISPIQLNPLTSLKLYKLTFLETFGVAPILQRYQVHNHCCNLQIS